MFFFHFLTDLCLDLTGIALSESVSGKCFIVDRLEPNEIYDRLSLPKIQLFGIPAGVIIDKGMGLKVWVGLIRTGWSNVARIYYESLYSEKDDLWYLGHTEDRREFDSSIKFLNCYSDMEGWHFQGMLMFF